MFRDSGLTWKQNPKSAEFKIDFASFVSSPHRMQWLHWAGVGWSSRSLDSSIPCLSGQSSVTVTSPEGQCDPVPWRRRLAPCLADNIIEDGLMFGGMRTEFSLECLSPDTSPAPMAAPVCSCPWGMLPGQTNAFPDAAVSFYQSSTLWLEEKYIFGRSKIFKINLEPKALLIVLHWDSI